MVPATAQDVSTAVTILAGKEQCKFAIKGQTHAPAAGFANIQAGATIDMASLNFVDINTDHAVVHVGAGAAWIDVYRFLDSYNVSVAGGRNGAVGVGGLTLGGGISYFLPQVGWACDNVLNFEVSTSHLNPYKTEADLPGHSCKRRACQCKLYFSSRSIPCLERRR